MPLPSVDGSYNTVKTERFRQHVKEPLVQYILILLLGKKTDWERKSFQFAIKTKTVIAVMIAMVGTI